MKLSIILGVLQMLLGLFCSLLNALHVQSELDIWCDFVPQAIFMLAVFGYLCFAIVYKWLVDWVALGLRPPSLISMLIAFAMSPGTVPASLSTSWMLLRSASSSARRYTCGGRMS